MNSSIFERLTDEPIMRLTLRFGLSGWKLFCAAFVFFFVGTLVLSVSFAPCEGVTSRISFLRDVSTVLDFSILNPSILVLFVSYFRYFAKLIDQLEQDNRIDPLVLKDVQLSHVLTRPNFPRLINWASFILACIVMVAHIVNTCHYTGYFAVNDEGGLSFPGYYMMFVTLVYVYLTVNLLARSVLSVVWLRKVFQQRVTVDFLHEDGCGGLANAGRVMLRLHFILFLYAITVALFVYADAYLFRNAFSIRNILALPGYLIFAPLLFVAPLQPIHTAMKRSREAHLRQLRISINELFNVVDPRSTNMAHPDAIAKAESLQKLIGLYRWVEEMPVWPVDLRTIGKFCFTMLIPLGAFIAQLIASTDSIIYHVDVVMKWFSH